MGVGEEGWLHDIGLNCEHDKMLGSFRYCRVSRGIWWAMDGWMGGKWGEQSLNINIPVTRLWICVYKRVVVGATAAAAAPQVCQIIWLGYWHPHVCVGGGGWLMVCARYNSLGQTCVIFRIRKGRIIIILIFWATCRFYEWLEGGVWAGRELWMD